jgi:hypothetical protein
MLVGRKQVGAIVRYNQRAKGVTLPMVFIRAPELED